MITTNPLWSEMSVIKMDLAYVQFGNSKIVMSYLTYIVNKTKVSCTLRSILLLKFDMLCIFGNVQNVCV